MQDRLRHAGWRGRTGRFSLCAAAALVLLSATAAIDAADPEVEAPDAGTCISCHDDERITVIYRTPHGGAADPASPAAQRQCASCHTGAAEHAGRQANPGDFQGVGSFGRDAATLGEVQSDICMNCHARHIDLAWRGSPHELNDTSCVDCHRLHTAADPIMARRQQADVCYECHVALEAESLKPSAHPIRFDKIACTDCHDPHASVTDALLAAPTLNQLCYDCHAEKRGPYLWEHAPVSEDCSLCHQPHGSIHPALLTQRQPLLCQNCHSSAGHASVALTTSSLPGGRPSALLLNQGCENCHVQVHGSNHPSGSKLMR